MSNVLLTGGTGFAGRCFIETILKYTDWTIVSLQRNAHLEWGERVREYLWDFTKPLGVNHAADLPRPTYFVHMGAKVHALLSLTDPGAFVQANVVGTLNALELARIIRPDVFVYISTAEVLGGRDEGYSTEGDPLRPSNPYAATKAAGELLCMSYHRMFDLPVVIVRTMNLYGEGQDDLTKFVPMVQAKVREGFSVKIHQKDGKPGVRQWIEGRNFANQLMQLMPMATIGEIYHIIGEELTNLQMASRIAAEMEMELKCEMVRMPKTHEWRYAIQATRGI